MSDPRAGHGGGRLAGGADRDRGLLRGGRCGRADGQAQGGTGDTACARAGDREHEGGRPMDEAPRTDSQEVDESQADRQRSPEEIREDIEATREQLGDTAAALAQKADVKAQARAKADEVKQKAAAKKDAA